MYTIFSLLHVVTHTLPYVASVLYLCVGDMCVMIMRVCVLHCTRVCWLDTTSCILLVLFVLGCMYELWFDLAS